VLHYRKRPYAEGFGASPVSAGAAHRVAGLEIEHQREIAHCSDAIAFEMDLFLPHSQGNHHRYWVALTPSLRREDPVGSELSKTLERGAPCRDALPPIAPIHASGLG
jgi:hypothetical protein